LVEYLDTLDCGIDEFYKDVRAAQHEKNDPYISTFIDCLLASADYESFYKVMAREGSRSAAKKIASVSSVASTNAESKVGTKKTLKSTSKYSQDDENDDFNDYEIGEKKSHK
jgi:hypothetical protein